MDIQQEQWEKFYSCCYQYNQVCEKTRGNIVLLHYIIVKQDILLNEEINAYTLCLGHKSCFGHHDPIILMHGDFPVWLALVCNSQAMMLSFNYFHSFVRSTSFLICFRSYLINFICFSQPGWREGKGPICRPHNWPFWHYKKGKFSSLPCFHKVQGFAYFFTGQLLQTNHQTKTKDNLS